ncbi:Tn3 family transposase [Desulfobacter hydrogenophilus]|uniref:Tn3 family transposase n=1 Tax=Desulfobacter hydrogenophilus TaxID=2291 RepID=A0A328FE34_9BACT|nr:Tn3 family transposase [Desulfobacter hydrogenophilus]NDY71056.1 Tn3 family transposase [Desulfobacter hydrogenophilus]QBH11698.1 Tn3 family transposase [Desulfobacter hydrogenophilus]RAM02911.1 Tn3 family transposase [Desulfobacter hydrogenophilus]
MATHLKILNQNDIKEFDFPPQFSGEERKRFFYLPNWAEELVNSFKTPTNQVGFALQFGYFKASNKFFVARKFHQKDIEFIAKCLGCQLNELDFDSYTTRSFLRHQELILANTGFRKYDNSGRKFLQKEAQKLCYRQMKPRLMFMSLVDFLKSQKMEIPNYHTFSEIITDALRNFEKTLIEDIDKHLSTEEKCLLDDLLEFGEEYIDGDKQDSKIKRYKVTLLKKSHQSTKPSKIKSNIKYLQYLEGLFKELEPIISTLNLSSELIQYYAQVVIKSRGFQMSRRESRRYLLLISFVSYQYYRLNDVLIDALLQSVQSTINTTDRNHKEIFYNQRKERHQKLHVFSQRVTSHLTAIEQAQTILHDKNLSADEKVESLQALFSEKFEQDSVEIQNQVNQLGAEAKQITKNIDFYDLLESKSLKLQNRASEIVKHIQFDEQTSNKTLLQAIEYYKKKDGNVGKDPPVDFLDVKEQKVLISSDGKFRVSLYKVLLFSEIANGIRSGALNLKFSYKYRAFDDYLISQDVWEANKQYLLEKAGLEGVQDFAALEDKLKKALQEQFRETNQNIINGKNEYATIQKDGSLKIKTPKLEKDITSEIVSDFFPKNRVIPLLEVLSTVNKISQFTDCFEYWQQKHGREKPDNKVFFAGITGYGCNLGITKTSQISRNINPSELENTTSWYFNHENIIRANDKILSLLDRLQLPKLFKRNQAITHTSSYGQKFSIGVDSLNASYSYKYFGKGKGVSVYSFIDECHRLFYSTVINSAEREAAYVIDGFMHNDVVQSDIHSTDTHGYSEMIFGVTHLLGISFAPRIKSFKKQQLYSFESPSILKDLGYHVLPKGTIDLKIIAEQWDQILRFIATIKLKETSASQLFRRLSSYSKQHPLYRALKQFGRIIKTLFLLRYIDDVELRQMIEKMLNKLESSNKFGKAVFHGNNQEFQLSTKEEQLIADGCKRLIENAIICWNYMYLSKKINDASSDAKKDTMTKTIKNGSVITWQHINLQGEYDFSEENLKNPIEFELPELLDL